MNCLTKNQNPDTAAEMLMDYGAGTLAPETAAALDAHARNCAGCRDALAAQKQVWQSLDLFAAPEVSADFDRRLLARIAQEPQSPAWRRWLIHLSAPASFFSLPVFAGAAACAALAIGLFVFVPGQGTGVAPVSDQNKQSRLEKVDIDQVEQALEDLDLLAPQPAASPM